MKGTQLLVFILIILLAVFSCTQPKGEGFAIYLLTRDIPISEMPVISHLKLADKPIISLRDIVSYSKQTHEIELTGEAYRRISELEIPVSGKVFVVSVDRRPIYWGAFWTPISSMSFEGVTIRKPLTSAQYTIKLELGYPSSDFFTGDDPRSNITILESLEQAGKLQ